MVLLLGFLTAAAAGLRPVWWCLQRGTPLLLHPAPDCGDLLVLALCGPYDHHHHQSLQLLEDLLAFALGLGCPLLRRLLMALPPLPLLQPGLAFHSPWLRQGTA